MAQNHPRFEKNAQGPFYTTGDCLACGAPEVEAPDLLAPHSDENLDTYFVKQPLSLEEVTRACSAAVVCCMSAIRYSGRDPAIIRELGNLPEYCDHVLPGGPIRMSWQSDEQWARTLAQHAPQSWVRRLFERIKAGGRRRAT
jgi:hypothetical protein